MHTSEAMARKWLTHQFDLSSQLSELRSVSIQVSPVLAKLILDEFNTRNRPFKIQTISKVKSAINEGRWKLTSQGISFSSARRLNNGQNRLKAIVETGKTVPLQITFGEDDDAFDVIDTDGSPRRGADVIALLGHPNSVNLYAIARLVMVMEKGVSGSNASLENHKVEAFLSSHPGLEEFIQAGRRVRSDVKPFIATAVSAALYFIKRDTKSKDLLKEFMEKLETGANLGPKSPILVLRSLATAGHLDAGYNQNMSKSVAHAMAIINAWNLFVLDQVGTRPKIVWNKVYGSPKIR